MVPISSHALQLDNPSRLSVHDPSWTPQFFIQVTILSILNSLSLGVSIKLLSRKQLVVTWALKCTSKIWTVTIHLTNKGYNSKKRVSWILRPLYLNTPDRIRPNITEENQTAMSLNPRSTTSKQFLNILQFPGHCPSAPLLSSLSCKLFQTHILFSSSVLPLSFLVANQNHQDMLPSLPLPISFKLTRHLSVFTFSSARWKK